MTTKEKKEYKEYKKIEALLKKSSKEVDKMLRQNKGFLTFVSPRAAV